MKTKTICTNYLGEIKTIDYTQLRKFFENNYPFSFTEVGVETFLKTLKIPVNYFLKQPLQTQIELLENAEAEFSSKKEFTYIYQNNMIQYFSSTDPDTFNELESRCPKNQNWVYLSEDLSKGYIRYFVPDKGSTITEDYTFGCFLDYPVLFTKPMIINLGFYALNPEDTTLNPEIIVPNTTIKLKKDILPETAHNSYFEELIKDAKASNIDGTLALLGLKPYVIDLAETELLEAEKAKLIHKGTSKKIRKYLLKEQPILDTRKAFVDLAIKFVNEAKSSTARNKFRVDILHINLINATIVLDVSFIENYREGF